MYESHLESEVKKLRKTIFNMLNYANMFVLVLNEEMVIKYSNNSLATALGFKSFKEIIGRCWIDFLLEDEIRVVSSVQKLIADGDGEWEKYKEFRNHIRPMVGEPIMVHWFNSHINSEYNWSFSFGLRKDNNPIMVTMDSIRSYYRDIIEYDRTMIESMKDTIIQQDRKTCQPTL